MADFLFVICGLIEFLGSFEGEIKRKYPLLSRLKALLIIGES